MQLLLSIFAVLLSFYILFKTFNKKKSKTNPLSNKTEKLTQKPGFKNKDPDPLLEDYDESDEEQEPLPAPISSQKEAPTLHEEVVMVAPAKPKHSLEFIAFSIVPKQQDFFPGRVMMTALKTNNFHLGKQDMFHLHEDDDPKKPILFSVASLLEPGVFNEEEMADNNYPGLLVYMILTKSSDPLEIFDKMLKSVRMIAAQLNGEILDNSDNVITAQLITEYRNAIKDYVAHHGETKAESA
jgi:cell division protein ZipA